MIKKKKIELTGEMKKLLEDFEEKRNEESDSGSEEEDS